MDEQRFVELLESLMLPDTEKVKTATTALNQNYYKSPQSLGALIQILMSHPNVNLRQLAAVEARKLVNKHWPAAPADQKPAIRQQLLEKTLEESGVLVRHSSARVIAQIAKLDIEDGQWTELPGILQKAALSEQTKHREVGVYILFALMDTLGDLFMENLDDLFTLFSKTIQDPDSSEVRVNTMLVLSRIAMLMDAEEDPKSAERFQSLIPSLVGALKKTIEDGEDDNSMQAFEVFQLLLGCDSQLLNKHFGDIVKFMMNIAENDKVDDDVRSQALAWLMQAVRIRKLKVQGLRIGEQLTITALKIVTELGDLSSDEEDLTPARSALGLLDILAQSLPPSQVVVPLLKAIGPYITNQDPDYRRAGILALGMCVEGAPDFIATQLKEVLPAVLHLLEDPVPRVRAAALNGVARLADDLDEDMGKEHGRLIPALVRNFDAAVQGLQSGQDKEENLGIVRGSCNAVDSLIEGLEPEDAAKYVPELVPRFSQFFTHDDHKSRVAAIGAVGSIASASEEAFLPYLEATMQALAPYVPKKESQEELELRGVVTDSMGKIAGAVGKEPFAQYVGPLMQASEEALHLDHPRLRESSYILWSTVAKVYEEEFAPYLAGVVKGLHECLEQDETDEVILGEEAADLLGAEVTIAGKKIKVASAEDINDGEDAIPAMGEDDDDWDDIETGATAVAMEKEIAVEVIGDVVTHVRAKYLPHLEESVQILLNLKDHTYEGVRKAALGTLWRTYATLWGLAEGQGMDKWKPGLPLKVQPSEELLKLGSAVMAATIEVWETEADRSTVTDINRDLAATLKLTGPAMLLDITSSTPNESFVPQISAQLLSILTKRHPCQQDEGEDAEPDEEELLDESSEFDWLVIETALDCLTCLAVALGEQFGELWKMFEKPVLKYASSQEAVEREGAVGTLAESVGNMGSAVTPYTPTIMKLLIRRMSDEAFEVKANAVYGIGLLFAKSDDEAEIGRNVRTVMEKLEPLLADEQPRVLDNAAGAVARIVGKYAAKLPLGEILPGLVDVIPAREDYEENKPVFDTIVQLYQSNNPEIQKLTPQLIPVFQKVLGPPEEQLEDETREKVVQLVQYLQKQG